MAENQSTLHSDARQQVDALTPAQCGVSSKALEAAKAIYRLDGLRAVRSQCNDSYDARAMVADWARAIESAWLPDFTYRIDGIFVAIMPETEAARAVWNAEIAPLTDGTGKVLAPQFPSTLRQLRAAGYIVRKSQPLVVTDAELLSLLDA